MNEGPILQEKNFQAKIVKGVIQDDQILDVDYKAVSDQEQNSSNKAKQRRLASQANNAKIFLSNSRPGTNFDSDIFQSRPKLDQRSSNVDALNEWQKVSGRNASASVEERLANLESQVAELKELINGKRTTEKASIFQEDIAANPNAKYMSSEKQYSGFIPEPRMNPKTLDMA